MQRSLFFIKQNSIKARIIHVSRANLNRRQAGAAREGVISDAGDAIRNCDDREAAAEEKGGAPNAGDVIRNRDARQAGAELEGACLNTGDAIRNRDAREALALVEGVFPDAGDRISLNCVGNDQLAGGGFIASGDGDFITFDFILSEERQILIDVLL